MVKNDASAEDESVSTGELHFLPERTCAICYQDQNPSSASENEIMAISSASGGVVGSAQTDVTTPYEAIPCGCVYCFVCIAKRLEAEEGEGWTCLRCGEVIKACRPWAGDVLEEVCSTPTKKTVSFSDDKDGQGVKESSYGQRSGVSTESDQQPENDGRPGKITKHQGHPIDSHEWAREDSDFGNDAGIRP